MLLLSKENPLLNFPRAVMPQGFAQPALQALLPDYQRNGYFVGNEWIGEGEQLLSLLPPLQRTRRMRGKDVVKHS